jgi:amino acid adenylation domain-containing protein
MTLPSPGNATNIVDLLETRAADLGEAPAFILLNSEGAEIRRDSFAGLSRRARCIAAELDRRELRGERVLILANDPADFVPAFLGCLYAGAVAVPVKTPSRPESLGRLANVARDCSPRGLFVDDKIADFLSAMGPTETTLAMLGGTVREVLRTGDDFAGATWNGAMTSAKDLAFLQYTSGSTGDPKGVMLSHRNLISNLGMIQDAFQVPADAPIVSWLPLFHDMGLIGNVLTTLYVGTSCVLLPSHAFSRKPVGWLQAIHRYRAAGSGGPNFAYELCARGLRDDEIHALDLSSWRLAYTGAEPVRAETLRLFARRFERCGFRARALSPTYGLAEATLFVSAGAPGAGVTELPVSRARLADNAALPTGAGPAPENVGVLVSCGFPRGGTEIRIVPPETGRSAPEGTVGEIWVSGPSVSEGYWQRHETNRAIFGATVEGSDLHFLRTGDLGFLLDGNLYVAGRLKDLIIIAGRNYHPPDVEHLVAQSHPTLLGQASTAFGVERDGAEVLVVVCEVSRATWHLLEDPAKGRDLHRQIADAVEEAIGREMELPVNEFVLLPIGRIPRTTSGKVRRAEVKRLFEADQIDGRTLAALAPTDEERLRLLEGPSAQERLELQILAAVAREVEKSPTGMDAQVPLVEYGLDSLRAGRLAARLTQLTGARLSLSSLFEFGNARALAAAIVGGSVVPASGNSEAREAIGLARRDSPARLSFAQERIWFISQLPDASVAYNLTATVALTGAIDIPALETSIGEVKRRHEALRSRVLATDGVPFAVIDEPSPFALVVRTEPQDDGGRPFDLASEHPFRVALIRLTAESHLLQVTLHHIAADGWSIGCLVRELSALYRPCERGAPPTLPALPVQYADYAAWERRIMDGEGPKAQLGYWTKRLAGPLQPLELPTDRPRSMVKSYRGGIVMVAYDADFVDELRALARASGATLFMVLLGGLTTLLRRLSGQTDIVVGTPVAHRMAPEVEPVIGMFVNTLALRSDLGADPSFAALLAQVKQTCVEAYSNQDIPFDVVVNALKGDLAPSLGHTPVFQVALALQKEELLGALKLEGLLVERLGRQSSGAKFDLAISFEETAEGLLGEWEYDSDLFDAATVARWGEELEVLLRAALVSPQVPVTQLDLLPAEETAQLEKWNETAKSFAAGGWIHEQIARWAERTPDAIAVRFGQQTLSYRELNRRANLLGRRLASQGVGPETLVGVCMERSLELVVGVLGVLKAGGAYVPLDPEYPPERLRYMAQDAGARLMLVQRKHADLVGGTEAIVLDEMDWIGRPGEEENLGVRLVAENAAYVIYTSGSTGRPKGVVNVHAGILNQLNWRQELLQLGAADKVMQKTPISFDVSVFDLFAPLFAGAEMVLAKPGGHRDPTYLWDLVQSAGVTVMHFVPSALRQFLDAAPAGGVVGTLRDVICSGEALPPDLVPRFIEVVGARLHNLYGPTEAAIDVSAWHCTTADGGRTTVPIGRPIANMQLHVLDDKQRRVPIGVAGELYIGGVGLARGYHGRADLTAERFVANPLDGGASRLYRTGDGARYLADGALEYLGRLDSEVKLRGYRIELQEIERNLQEHPAVKESAVVKRQLGQEDALVAYVVAATAAGFEPEVLREHLARLVPSYMIPSLFVPLSELPVTPSHKLDRRLLAQQPLNVLALRAETTFVAPSGPIEENVAAIYQEILAVERLGATDDVFALGAHSLLLMRAQARLRKLGFEVSIVDLFQRVSVRSLAKLLEGRTQLPAQLEIQPLRPELPKPLSRAQKGMWFISRSAGAGVAYNLPGAVELTGALDVEALRWSLGEIVRRHEILRSRIVDAGAGPALVVDDFEALVLQVEPLPEGSTSAALAACLAAESMRPFVLERDHPFRVRLIRIEDERHLLLGTFHHSAVDGWSVGIFISELAESYNARRARRLPLLPAPEIQYADHAAWENGPEQAAHHDAQLAYWKSKLQGAPPLLQLPLDRPRSPSRRLRAQLQEILLPADLVAQLQAHAQGRGSSLFMILVAGLSALLRRLSGQTDIVVGTPVAHRTRPEVERVIGMFVNSLPLRIAVGDEPTFADLLARTKQTCVEAFSHQDAPIDMIVDAVGTAVTRDPSYTPLFQVGLALQKEELLGALQLDGLQVKRVGRQSSGAKFDLTISFEETKAGLLGEVEYDSDLFDGTTVARWGKLLEMLLRAAVASPQVPVTELQLLPAEETGLLEKWNATAKTFATGGWMHEQIERWAERTPDAIAVRFGKETLSYRELNRRANLLGRRLARQGVGPETLVGVCMERSFELVVGLLGVLKTGGAYVPLDPDYPTGRLRYIAEDAGVRLMLVQRKHADLVRGAETIVVDEVDWVGGPGEEENLGVGLLGENAACVIYTSGLMGQPKGVVNVHAGILNQLNWRQELLQLGAADKVMHKTPISFGASVSDLFAPLFAGAEMVLAKPGGHRDPKYLWELVQEVGVTVMHFVPSALRQFLAAVPARGAARTLRDVICSGEALPPDLVQRFIDVLGVRLHNLYGPTEAAIDVSTWQCTTTDGARATVPIGRPIANMQLHVLDDKRRRVPIGVAGELYIGGVGLARGYHGRADLTAERFVANPLDGGASRLYRTGDEVRYLADGALEYLGRLDSEVKLRGYRIELQEIERNLQQHAGVKESAVVKREVEQEEALVAFVVAESAAEFDPEVLREHLSRLIPSYMIPSLFVCRSELPVTVEGRLDRSALMRANVSADTSASALASTATSEKEVRLVTIYREALEMPDLTATENIFGAGAHSLLLVRLQARLQMATGIDVPLEEFFYRPNVRRMQRYLDEDVTGKALHRPPLDVPAESPGGPESISLVVGTPELPLGATLTLPRGPGPHPAVVLVHGSGPMDRDETVGPNKPFRDLAEGLAAARIAVLRYDKRTFAHRAVLDGNKLSVDDEIVKDALSALEILAKQPGIRRDAIFVVGHSLGAWLAPEIAFRAGWVAGAVLLAPPGRPLLVGAIEQLRIARALPEQRLAELQAQADRIARGEVQPGEHFLDTAVSKILDVQSLNSIEKAARLKKPMLVLRGERDYQSTEADLRLWRDGSGNAPVECHNLPNLNHLFIAGTGPVTSEENKRPGRVAAEVIDRMATFIHETSARLVAVSQIR